MNAIQTSMAVPLFKIVNAFHREPTQFKQWIKDVERYAQLVGMGDAEIPKKNIWKKYKILVIRDRDGPI